jgi:hypothetical protein
MGDDRILKRRIEQDWTGGGQNTGLEDGKILQRRIEEDWTGYRLITGGRIANYWTGRWLNITQKDGIRPGQEDGIILDRKMTEYWKER